VWVVYEMLDYQRAVDAYHQQCVQGDPVWRGAEALAQASSTDGSDFVRSLVDAGRALLPEQSRQ
jgi:hypothetical protein